MKHATLIMAAAILLGTATSCGGGKQAKQEGAGDDSIIGRTTHIDIKEGLMTPEVLWAMGRIGDVSVSPDGSRVAYGVTYYSVPQNKSHRTVYVMNADGKSNTLITKRRASDDSPAWIKGGHKIAYLSNKSGSNQLWMMDADGSDRKQITKEERDIEGFKFSPDETQVILIERVPIDSTVAQKYPDLPKATGRIITDLMYKHWDEWLTDAPHPFLASFDGDKVTGAQDLLEGTKFDCPNRPFSGMEQLAWSPNSKLIAYSCVKKSGLDYAVSTDADIYLYNTIDKTTVNLCKLDERDKNPGYDTHPQFSPDGTMIAWLSMPRDGYESDQNRLCLFDLQSKSKSYPTEKSFESNVEDYCWAPDGTSLYFVGVWHGTSMIHRVNRAGEVQQITDGQYDYTSVALLGKKLIAARQSMEHATELFAVDPATTPATVTQLTNENKAIYDKLAIGKVEPRWTKTTDGKDMLSWVVYPPHFDKNKKYPAILFCEGGPQTPVSQFWSYRWNLQIMAANGYIIICPNRRGLPGFGMEWNEAISGDYGGQCMKDLFSAIDDLCKEPYIDTAHVGCVGASFGGYTVYWMAGHHNKRFKAFIAHDGFFNMEQQYYETEEMWFPNFDLGGAPYMVNDAKVKRSYANSPHLFVANWDTPILCIHGERDYRILASQAQAAFNAARLRGIPAELLLFPDENHWVLKPQNGILWQRIYFEWLDKWLKEKK